MEIGYPKISIVVPVYNVEKYLDRCLCSIVAQTYVNLEIILVDDGSKDDSSRICDLWSLKDKRVKVIHKSNGGLAEARNVGIEYSTGDYILFIDSDDYICANMCSNLYEKINYTQADIAVCNFYWEYPTHREKSYMLQDDGFSVSRDYALEEYFLHWSIPMVVAWNKLFRRELFFTKEMIRYPVGRLHEDEYTIYRLFYAARKIVFLKEPLYYYVQREDSIMYNLGGRNVHDLIGCAYEYLHWADKYSPDKRRLLDYGAMNILWRLLRECEEVPELMSYKNEVYKFGKELSCNVKNYWSNPYIDKIDKMRYGLFKMGMFLPLRRLFHWCRKAKK